MSVCYDCVLWCVSVSHCIGVHSEVGCQLSAMLIFELHMNVDLHYISFSFVRYQPVAPRWWTDPLLSELRELPSLTGKLPAHVRPPVSTGYDGCSL